MQTSELEGAALDWAVAKCEGLEEETLDPLTWAHTAHPSGCYSFSTNWAIGGPIIERHIFRLEDEDGIEEREDRWVAEFGASTQYGPTALIAAMRCYVASKLGYTVEVPEELL